METQRWLRQARRAAEELHASGRAVPLADVIVADGATRAWLQALSALGLVGLQDVSRPDEGSELRRLVA